MLKLSHYLKAIYWDCLDPRARRIRKCRTPLYPPGRNEQFTDEPAVKCVQCGKETALYRADVPYCVGCMDRSEQNLQENSGTSLLETDKRRFEQDKKP